MKKQWIIGLIALLVLGGCSSEKVEQQAETSPFIVTQPEEVTQFTPSTKPRRELERDKIRATVNEYVAYLDTNPQGEDRPAKLRALANLYIQKYGDYEKAAECFDVYIQENPSDPQIALVYVQLSDCYEQLGWQEKSNTLHFNITRIFPEESDLYKYAQQKLKGL